VILEVRKVRVDGGGGRKDASSVIGKGCAAILGKKESDFPWLKGGWVA